MKNITLFEHETLRLGKGAAQLNSKELELLQRFYGERGQPYFSLTHQGVKFCEYVGVLQVGELCIEVLPKADRIAGEEGEKKWRSRLIEMLRLVGSFEIHAPSSSLLQLQPNAVLDLYFELFIAELEYLLHCGLIKRYKKTEGNSTALKGNLQFAKQIQQNICHQERFYVRYSTYNTVHPIHQILYKALKLLNNINRTAALKSRIGALLLNFPEMPDITVTEASFEQLVFDRKNEHYQKALEIARLILLNYHPDLSAGKEHVLALMFDMNALWERFVYISLRRWLPEAEVWVQHSKSFWKPEVGTVTKMRPDIVLRWPNIKIVLDTKWKNLHGKSPSPEDLRQMYVYHEYFEAQKTALLYPDVENKCLSGKYFDKTAAGLSALECSLLGIAIPEGSIVEWQRSIAAQVEKWATKK